MTPAMSTLLSPPPLPTHSSTPAPACAPSHAPAAAAQYAAAPQIAAAKWQIIGGFANDLAGLLDRCDRDASAKTEIELRVSEACNALKDQFSDADRATLAKVIKDELLAMGPIQPLLD